MKTVLFVLNGVILLIGGLVTKIVNGDQYTTQYSRQLKVEPDIRITKAMGPKGYDKVRVSVISDQTYPDEPLFNYSAQFQHRWTDKYLSTGIVSVVPGQSTKISVLGKDFNIFLPKETSGVRGIIFADPCFRSDFLYCQYGEKYNLYHRHTAFLNAAFSFKHDMNFWQILGDNFYDRDGKITSQWFSGLSDQTKSSFFATVPGNHDFWINADPKVYSKRDQMGNGFMQFYGQDTVSSLEVRADNSFSPYDLSVDPSGGSRALPPASNFFFYNKIGNTAFIGFSGAHRAMKQYFDDACDWLVEAQPEVVLLLGHWHQENNGADFYSATPNVYNKRLLTNPKCAPIAAKIRYFMGHKHCNVVTQPNIGFMVGAQGMMDVENCLVTEVELGFLETMRTTVARAVAPTANFLWGMIVSAFSSTFGALESPAVTRKSVQDAITAINTSGGADIGMPVVDTTGGRCERQERGCDGGLRRNDRLY